MDKLSPGVCVQILITTFLPILMKLIKFSKNLRYFIVKSCNRENLELSVQQGVWATQRSNESKLNEAFDSVENVILVFSVNRTRHFQVCLEFCLRLGYTC
jgi:DNA primase catalytic subunit